jgi:hypothetical protein
MTIKSRSLTAIRADSSGAYRADATGFGMSRKSPVEVTLQHKGNGCGTLWEK